MESLHTICDPVQEKPVQENRASQGANFSYLTYRYFDGRRSCLRAIASTVIELHTRSVSFMHALFIHNNLEIKA